ncbi:trypsin-like peptidase domain-containing protein [Candidatus Peregrinibacteria bacterium]|nr:trypsin-like peptidase domain-containing protein [Candidatus Peregrinibacteria bacterium]
MSNFPLSQNTLSVIILSFFAGIIGGGVSAYVIDESRIVQPQGAKRIVEERQYIEESALISAREKVAPSVISIVQLREVQTSSQSFTPFDNFFFGFPGFEQPTQPQNPEQNSGQEPEKRVVGGGTGFIISKSGLALTNKHVVNDDASEYIAVMNDGTEYGVKIVGKDSFNDLAVIQITEKDGGKLQKELPIAELGDSNALKIGQRVLAIGNALAEYDNTTTAGIISAKGRDIVASDSFGGSREQLSGLIQTDAAINPGNSGGPLVNLEGQVIGINTAIDAQANGVSFAIPINDVKPILASIEQYGKIVRPILGVRYIILTEEKAKELGLTDVTHGAFLVGDYNNGELAVIAGGPADKAGLKVEDVILELDGQSIDKDNTLQSVILKHKPGDKVQLKVWRKGETLDATVELGVSDDLKTAE